MKGFSGRSYLCRFQAGNSPVHNLPAGWKMCLTVLLSASAFAARDPLTVAGLALVIGGYYFLAGLRPADFWRDIRLFLLQTAVVVILYMLKDGIAVGLGPGVRTGLQILLFFLPGAVYLRTTQASQIMRSLQHIMPRRMAFFIFTSFRFIPFFAREIHEIAMAQRLRGARLEPRHITNPKNWKDFMHCLMIPLIVRALVTSKEAALSAEARGFGRVNESGYKENTMKKVER